MAGGLLVGQSNHLVFALDEARSRFGWIFTDQIARISGFAAGR